MALIRVILINQATRGRFLHEIHPSVGVLQIINRASKFELV